MSKQIKWKRAKEIEKLVQNGVSYRKIAKIYDVHHTTIMRDFWRLRKKLSTGKALQSVAS